MKNKLTIAAFLLTSTLSGWAQGFATDCATIEQQQAAYNRNMANGIRVVDTYSQQLQTYYQQLATYYQQLDKDNQQKAKDAQQKAKDIQQMEKDAQQLAWAQGGYDELDLFIVTILPRIGECSGTLKQELQRIHTNRSGGGDGTNPGDHGNILGFDNPHKVH